MRDDIVVVRIPRWALRLYVAITVMLVGLWAGAALWPFAYCPLHGYTVKWLDSRGEFVCWVERDSPKKRVVIGAVPNRARPFVVNVKKETEK